MAGCVNTLSLPNTRRVQIFFLVLSLVLTRYSLCGYAFSPGPRSQQLPPPRLECEICTRSNPGLISTPGGAKIGGELQGRFLHITDIVSLTTLALADRPYLYRIPRWAIIFFFQHPDELYLPKSSIKTNCHYLDPKPKKRDRAGVWGTPKSWVFDWYGFNQALLSGIDFCLIVIVIRR